MKQNTIENESLFAQAVRILRAHIGQIDVEACKEEKWVTGVKFSIDISLSELDENDGEVTSECLDALSDNNGVITDADLVHALNPCLADINAIDNEQYAIYLRNLVQDGGVPSHQLYDWKMGYPFWFYKDTQTLRLTIIGKPKDMYLHLCK